jgi:hypothetical protein
MGFDHSLFRNKHMLLQVPLNILLILFYYFNKPKIYIYSFDFLYLYILYVLINIFLYHNLLYESHKIMMIQPICFFFYIYIFLLHVLLSILLNLYFHFLIFWIMVFHLTNIRRKWNINIWSGNYIKKKNSIIQII